MKKPLISVVILANTVTHNLEKTIDSVLNNSYKHIEIPVI